MAPWRTAVMAVALAGCGAAQPAPVPAARAGDGLLVPEGAEATWIVRVEDFGSSAPRDVHLRIRLPHGDPVLRAGDVFLPLAGAPGAVAASAFAVPRARGASDAAWMGDGSLALIVGRQLGVAGRDGFVPFAQLPADVMHLAPASTGECFVFGGGRLLLYRDDGQALDLLRLPTDDAATGSPTGIAAVVGSRERLFVATGSSVLSIVAGAVPAIVYDEGDGTPIGSLAAADGGVFVGSSRGVTFVAADGRAVAPVLRGRAAEVASRVDAVYVWVAGEGLLRIAPTTGYAALAAALAGADARAAR